MSTGTDTLRRSYQRALINGEVGPQPVAVIAHTIHPRDDDQEEVPTHPRVHLLRTHPATTASTSEILDKIKDLQECTTKELENVIKDLLPRFQIMLHPSYPAYEREYPTASTEFTLYRVMDHPEEQLEKKTGPWSQQRSASMIGKEVKNTTPIRKVNSQEAMYMPPAWEPTFQYQCLFMMSPCDVAGWRIPIHLIPLEAEPASKHGYLTKTWIKKKGYCYLNLYKRCYRYSVLKIYSCNPPLRCLNLSATYLTKDFKDLKVSIDWEGYQIHISPDRREHNIDLFQYMNPRRLLESGWHELTRVGAKPDAQDYAQMTPEELKTQLQIIKDLQESQRQQTLELEQKEIKEEDIFDEDEEKLIRHFKKIAIGLKGEGHKYNWLEKPKTFDGTHSKYRQFKQSVQWYLYT
jgi:hypothetical protein